MDELNDFVSQLLMAAAFVYMNNEPGSALTQTWEMYDNFHDLRDHFERMYGKVMFHKIVAAVHHDILY